MTLCTAGTNRDDDMKNKNAVIYAIAAAVFYALNSRGICACSYDMQLMLKNQIERIEIWRN